MRKNISESMDPSYEEHKSDGYHKYHKEIYITPYIV